MATKKPATRQATLDDLLNGGYRYLDLPDEAAEEAPAAPEPSGMLRRVGGDTGIALVKGAISLPEALVGMADLVSGGRAGQLAESAGFRPKEAKAILDEYLSPEQKAANAAVQQAEGFTGKLGAAVTNPSVIWQGAVESAPSMLGAASVARGAMALAPRLPGVVAAGMGEGAVSAGMTAEQVRQETADGRLTGMQSLIAGTSGAVTGVIGAIAGKVAQKLGIGDVDTMLAGVKSAAPAVQKGVVRQILEGALSEGVLEELPQSVQEQVAQNLALNKPLDEGVDHAAVLGMLAGGLMGGVAGPLVAPAQTPAGKAIREEKMPEVGPLTRALNTVTETRARQADAGMPIMTADQATVGAKVRADELAAKTEGTADEDLPGPDGEPVTIPGTPGEMLTADEQAEQQFLTENADNPEALARAQGATISAAAPRDPEQVFDRMHQRAADDAQSLRQWDGKRQPRGGDEMSESGVMRALEGERTFDAPAATADDVREAIDEVNRRDAQTRAMYADITRPGGEPFRNKTAAVRAMRGQANPDDFTVATVEGGYVLRPVKKEKEQPDGSVGVPAALGPAASGGAGAADGGRGVAADGRPAAAPAGAVPVRDGAADPQAEDARLAAGRDDAAVAAPIAGARIDDEWTAFAPESGTKGIPRADMPQIKAEHRGAMTQFFKGRGIEHEQEADVDATTLKPTQAEFAPGKVQKAKDFTDTNRAILVSSDGHILDGHHQWLAAREAGAPIRVIRLNAPIDKLLEQIKEFPSAERAEGATASEQSESRSPVAQARRETVAGEAPSRQPAEASAEPQTNPRQGGSQEQTGVASRDDSASTRVDEDTPEARWTRMQDADRLGVLGKAGWSVLPKPSLATQRMTRLPWDKMTDSQRERIGAALEQNAEPKAPDGANTQPVQQPEKESPNDVAQSPKAGTTPGEVRPAASDVKATEPAAPAPTQPAAEAEEAAATKAEAPAPQPAADAETAAEPVVEAAAPIAKPEKAGRLTDAGEELIRNRRGKLKGLAWDDVSAMNDTLKVAQVIKANVWPRPDYAKMVEDGAPAWKAAAFKAVYDKLAAAPVTRTAPTNDDLKAYIETMHAVRDALTAELDRIQAAAGDKAVPDLWKLAKADNVFGKVFPTPPADGNSLAARLRPSPFDRSSEQGKANNKRALLIGGNGAVQALQFGHRALTKVKDLLAEGFPAKQEAWQKSWEVRSTETRDSDVPEAERTGQPQQRFYVYEKGSTWRLAKGGQDGGYATRELAEAFARSLTAKKREALPPSRGLDLADVRRTGPDWRAGKDVTAKDIMDRFGFRGVNLGEYVKAKQGIAQIHLNHVYDAFSDLADLLGVPPKAMSLNGTLGVAVGAQGSGKALAHFVPGLNEMNITRDSGAGALAHEFGHALDHYFAAQHGRAVAMAKRPYLSAALDSLGDEAGGVRPEVVGAMREVMKTINSRPMTEAEARKYMDDQRALNQRRLDRWITEFKGNKGADKAALNAVAEKLKRGDVGEPQDTDVETNLAEMMRAAALKPGNSIAANAFTTAYRLRDLADEARFMATHIPQVDTDYAKASAAMDAKKAAGDGYWSTPWEKFARAFETFAMDALSDRNRESLYLSGMVDGAGWKAWADATGKSIPYPAGAERLAMQQAFQKLVDTIETRDTDDGVAMFSRTGRKGSDPAKVQDLAEHIASRWVNAPPIVVVQNMQDPRVPPDVLDLDKAQRSQDAEGDPAAFFHGGTVYLVAEQMGGAADTVKALFHESLGHYGLRGNFGKDLGVILDRLAQLNPGKVRAKAKAYGLDFDKLSERRQAAEEVLAEMAQISPELGWVKRAIAAIRSWLRQNVPGFGAMKFSDDEIIRSFILPARNWVKNGPTTTFVRSAAAAPAFSRSSDAIDTMRSAFTARGLSERAADLLQSDRTFNWWHRSIGTQYQKAKADPEHFGRVYEGAQDYLHDTSAFANDAAGLAPDVVPQLKGWRDAMRSLRLSEPDGKVLADAVFQGTLVDQQVYDADELRTRFGMNDRQIGLYRQFRASVNRSLDILVATDVARYIGQDIPPALKAMISDGDTGRFRGLVSAFAKSKRDAASAALAQARKDKRTRLAEMWADQRKRLEGTKPGSRLAIEQALEEDQRKVRAEVDAAIATAEAEARKWVNFERVTREKYERIDQLKQEGYAPLMRFGRYTVYVTGQAGEQQFFGLYESQADANRAAREFRASPEFEGSSVETGVLSEEAYKQFAGMAPETIELFAEVAGVERTPLFEEYLRRAKSNRSALKRLIGRKGIAGYSEDAQRVLASFLTSNARAASSNLHLGDLSRLIEQIPKQKGDVKDEAIRLREYVQNPTEEAQRLRGLLFVQYLGGSVASALVNMTQPFMMTFPYLSQFGGAAKAAARLGAAMKSAIAKPDVRTPLGAALAKAEKEGIVSPQELHQLQAESSRTMGNHPGLRRLLFVWGSAFSLAEQFNRRVSFIAAYQTAIAEGKGDPFKFAVDAVDQTQGVYNRGNRPNWARGPVGATLFTFKQYSISYLEFLKRLPPQQRAIALLVLVLAAGAQGLPFADDLDDLIDTLGQHAGYDTNVKAWKHQLLTDALGAAGADFALHGFSAMPGFPLDVSGRLALSNLLPGTGMLLKHKTDKAGEVFDVLGPAGGVMRDALKGEARPLAIRNLAKGLEMYQTGEYRDTRDRRVMDTTDVDALVKGVGFQPAEVARESRKIQLSNQQVQLARTIEAEIASEWAQGIADKEPDKVLAARERLAQWNRDNPRSRIAINTGQLQRRVREMRISRQERFQKTIPREMRATVDAE